MKKSTVLIWLFILSGIILLVSTASGQDIKERMKERLPILIDLKARGLVGEDNSGYLQFVGGGKEKEDVVAAENTDRRAVYDAIAKQQGTSPDLVGRRRAIQIASSTASGEWLQDASGNWYRK